MGKNFSVAQWLLLLLTLASTALPTVSATASKSSGLRPLPPALASISDETETLITSQGEALAERLFDIEQKTQMKIFVMIVTTVYPETIEAYVQRVIDRWRNSSQKLASGRFVFIVIAKPDRAIRVVPGQQLTWILQPFAASGIMNNTSAMLKQGKYFEALEAIAATLSKLVESQKERT